MKKVAIMFALGLLLTGAAHAQIPVTDGASIMDRAIKHVETIKQWSEQAKQMQSQIDQMKSQYESLTGSRNLGEIFNDPALRDYLPTDWQDVYDSVREGGYASLSGRASELYNANKQYDACATYAAGAQRTACEAGAVKPFQDKAFALDAYDQAKDRLNQIDRLMQQISKTDDPKAIAELQSRIASEQAMIANEQTKLQLYSMVADAEQRVQEQRQRELAAKELARRGHVDLTPLTFD
ncbi:P-type DNA transfer protein VirB5 [Rhizobium sp. TRM95111]|uniref:P-type DNA transfer protein VirB5 n=1 Tax=Rhizobium alarense TaxID=2846851 RepID=UPI001F3B5372|nr:P-type DNA transfer protein VirB5 [Rhizobium alarense]MCF3642946.1 P-type DNA transfer protein VirB5 [Rhizobium alarense]